VKKVIKRDKTGKATEVAIRPDKKSRHPGEPTLIHRRIGKFHKSGGK
jgi:hypothetical protein